MDTFATGKKRDALAFLGKLDIRPATIIERFALRRPIYRRTTNYGHLGKAGLPWEA